MANCSWCYGAGHNRRSCPRRSDEAKKRDPKPRCSYCNWKGIYEGSSDHNRRNCPTLKADLQEAYRINSIYRKGAIEILSENGVGPGSLIVRSEYGWSADNKYVACERPYIIRSLSWNRFSTHVGSWLPAFTASPLSEIGRLRQINALMPIVNGETWIWDEDASQWIKTVSHYTLDRHINHNACLTAGSFNASDSWLAGYNPAISQLWRNSRKP